METLQNFKKKLVGCKTQVPKNETLRNWYFAKRCLFSKSLAERVREKKKTEKELLKKEKCGKKKLVKLQNDNLTHAVTSSQTNGKT